MRSSSAPRARPAPDSPASTFESIVAHYIATERTFPKLAYYVQQPSLEQALEVVALFRRDHHVEGHQRRLSRAAKAGAGERIRKLRLADVRNFDEIHQRVQKAIGSIRGIGTVAVYDVALRIGMYLGKLPRRVSLQAGARAAARALGVDVKQ